MYNRKTNKFFTESASLISAFFSPSAKKSLEKNKLRITKKRLTIENINPFFDANISILPNLSLVLLYLYWRQKEIFIPNLENNYIEYNFLVSLTRLENVFIQKERNEVEDSYPPPPVTSSV